MNKIIYPLMLILVMCSKTRAPEELWKIAELMRNDNNMKECIINLETIIKNHSEHALAARAQYQIAEIYLNDIKDFDIAIEEYTKVIDYFPNHDVSKNSLFMIAYIYNNYLSAYTDAIKHYNLFIEKYPDDELIPSVKYELEGLLNIETTIDSLNKIVTKK